MMCSPDFRFARSSTPPRGQQCSEGCHVLGLHEQFGECLMGAVHGGRCKHQFTIRGDVESAVVAAGVGDGQVAYF
jgi:hypothetical protein